MKPANVLPEQMLIASPGGCGELACGTMIASSVSSDHELRAWTGGSTGGNGGTACCCMMLGHVDTLVAEDESTNVSEAEEASPGHEVAGEESSAGGNGPACGTCGGCDGFSGACKTSDHVFTAMGGSAGGCNTPAGGTTASGRRATACGHGCGPLVALQTEGGCGIVCERMS